MRFHSRPIQNSNRILESLIVLTADNTVQLEGVYLYHSAQISLYTDENLLCDAGQRPYKNLIPNRKDRKRNGR